MDIRLQTALIIRKRIRKKDKFLVGRILDTADLRWSSSPWDAWSTRDRKAARRVRHFIGGDIMLWNPVTGEMRDANI